MATPMQCTFTSIVVIEVKKISYCECKKLKNKILHVTSNLDVSSYIRMSRQNTDIVGRHCSMDGSEFHLVSFKPSALFFP